MGAFKSSGENRAPRYFKSGKIPLLNDNKIFGAKVCPFLIVSRTNESLQLMKLEK